MRCRLTVLLKVRKLNVKDDADQIDNTTSVENVPEKAIAGKPEGRTKPSTEEASSKSSKVTKVVKSVKPTTTTTGSNSDNESTPTEGLMKDGSGKAEMSNYQRSESAGTSQQGHSDTEHETREMPKKRRIFSLAQSGNTIDAAATRPINTDTFEGGSTVILLFN